MVLHLILTTLECTQSNLFKSITMLMTLVVVCIDINIDTLEHVKRLHKHFVEQTSLLKRFFWAKIAVSTKICNK